MLAILRLQGVEQVFLVLQELLEGLEYPAESYTSKFVVFDI